MDQSQRASFKGHWAAIIMLLVLSLHGAAGQTTTAAATTAAATTAAATTAPATTSASPTATTTGIISTTTPASTSATTASISTTESSTSSTTAPETTTTVTGSTTTATGSTTTTTTASTATTTTISADALGDGLEPWEIALITLAALAVGLILLNMLLMAGGGMFSNLCGSCGGSYSTNQVQPTFNQYEMERGNCHDHYRNQQC